MDRVSELYDTAEKSGIEVLSFPLPETGSISIEQGGKCYIGIDSRPEKHTRHRCSS